MAQDEEFSPPKPQNALAIFCRAPRLGTVKTRLAQTHGDEFALGLYRAMLADTFALGRALAPAVETFACFTPPEAFEGENSLAQLWDGPKIAQCEGDLGARMLDCLAQLRARGFERVALIGSDSPNLPLHYIQAAFDQLNECDLVVGPSRDGGFYLIGASCELPESIFDGVVWGSELVYDCLLDNRQQSSLNSRTLSLWHDVDDAGDLFYLHRHLFNGWSYAPHTRQFLEEINHRDTGAQRERGF